MTLISTALGLIEQNPFLVENPSPFNIKWVIPRLILLCPITKLAHSSEVCAGVWSAAVSHPHTFQLCCSLLGMYYTAV